jgi:hypothetical protein
MKMRILQVLTFLSVTLYYADGVGFRYRADLRSGEKRLWIHVPGSEPNVLTDFDESKKNSHICVTPLHPEIGGHHKIEN